jgi:hypothetical protein
MLDLTEQQINRIGFRRVVAGYRLTDKKRNEDKRTDLHVTCYYMNKRLPNKMAGTSGWKVSESQKSF